MATEINALIADARRRFRAAGIERDEAALDARLLAQGLLGWDSARLLTHGDEAASPEFSRDFEGLVARRAFREPLAYITGSREFWNLDIEVTPAVLIPRQETELLIEIALEHFDHQQPIRMLDVCTGSGCVAVGLGREFPKAALVASDMSQDALDVARRNLARYGVSPRTQCVRADLLDGIAGPFDLIVSNPPYVRTGDAPDLQPEVREYEPPAALFAGEDGLQLIKRLVVQAAAALARDGIFAFEFGAGQDQAVAAIIAAVPTLTLLDVKHDLQDLPRAAVTQKNSRS